MFMDYAVKVTVTFVSVSLLCVICFFIDKNTSIEWYKIMAVMALWFSCKANLDVSILEDATRSFMEKVIFLIANSQVDIPEDHTEPRSKND